MFIAKGLCGRLFVWVGQQNRRISWYKLITIYMAYLCIVFIHSLFPSLSKDRNMYIIQCSLQGGMRNQERHYYNFQYINNII
jgi:hypothetical protein